MRRWQLLSPKRIIPVFLAGAAGIFVLADVLQPSEATLSPALRIVAQEILRWVVVLTAFALLAGVVSIIIQHIRRLLSRNREGIYSLALLAGLFTVIVPAIVGQVQHPGSDPLDPTFNPLIQDLFVFVYTPLSASLLALLAFFGLSAALRALGSGRREAVVLVLVAVVLLVIQLPLAGQIPAVGAVATWIQSYLVLAGARALILGGAIGALVASVRILMGVDRPYLDR